MCYFFPSRPRALFVAVYALSGFAGSCAHVAFAKSPKALGASGAVCGLFGFEVLLI